MSTYTDYLRRQSAQWGDKFNPVGLAPQFQQYLHNQDVRLTVTRTYPSGETYTRKGWVGVTTGWSPCFLLMSRVGVVGSSDCLDERDTIVAVGKRRRT